MSVTTTNYTRTNLREFAYTRDNFRKKYINVVFDHSPTLAMLASQMLGEFGGVKLRGVGHKVVSGGHAIAIPVVLGTHAGASRSSGPFGTHNVAPDDNTMIGTANWAFYNHGLAISEHDRRINRGDAARASFVESQTRHVMLALADLLGDDIYSTSAPATAITSLPSLLSADDTVQGLSGSTYPRYNSRGLSAIDTAAGSISFASGSFAAQGLADMRTGWNNASEGMIQPNVITTDYATHERYEGALTPQERFSGAVKVADGSFGALAFKSTPVIADRKATAGSMFFLRLGDEEGIQMTFLQGADFDFGPFKPSSNQTVDVSPLEATVQLTIGNRQFGSNRMDTITD